MTAVPFDIVRAAHAELLVTDLDEAAHLYVDLLGFALTERTPDALYLRALEDTHHHALVLRRAARPAVGHLAFRVRSPEDVALAADHFAAIGCETRVVEAGAEAGQGEAVRVRDPLGFVIEFFHEMSRTERLLQRFDVQRGAQPMRIDHFNIQVPDVRRGFDHWTSLGFLLTESIEREDADDPLVAVWLRRKQTVHDVALTPGEGPRLHHLGIWVADTDAVLRTCDVLAAGGHLQAIERGPGRHGVSNAFYVYLRDPDGHRIELYTYDYFTGDPDFEPIRWSVDDAQRRSFWGHAVPHSWWAESTVVIDLDGRPVETEEPKVVEEPRVAVS
jgi:3,4-dihydroxyphenylacetate 2,3-dioxygenase